MDLHYLKIFNIMAMELSFSRTANELYVSQPAVSMQIRKLEKDLGFRLFDRHGRNITLNDNGRMLHEYTKKIFLLVEEAENRISHQTGHLSGTMGIAASNTPGTYILPSIIGRFKDIHPLVEVNLHIGNTHEVEKLVLDNKVDFAVNGGDIPYSRQVNCERLFCDDIVLIASPVNKIFNETVVEPAHLINSTLISHERNSQLYKAAEAIMLELSLPITPSMTFGSIDAIKQAVAAKLGISAVPRSSIGVELKFGLLRQIHLEGRHWDYPYNLIYHKSRHISPQCEKLMMMVREAMKGDIEQ